MSAPGHAKGEHRSAQPGGTPSSSPLMADAAPLLLWAPQAWLADGWRERVLMRVGADGHWTSITPDCPAPPEAVELSGPVLPSLVNAHSHAFQRAFAGLAERRSGEHDDFWSWRDRMYGVALRITPAQLRAVAAQLYAELLQGGYTQVCEFHYLHHAPDGRPHDDPLAMSRALVQAAADAGIGLTMLPVLYQRAGFDQPRLRDDQRRFAQGVDQVLAQRDAVRTWRLPQVDAGVAVHSLRAAAPEALQQLARDCAGDGGPIHIHVAEQTAEVQACLAATGARPIEWLARELPLDARWQLVHATHALPGEIEAIAATGAGIVICPGTEGNLGDGLCDLPRWLAAGVPTAIGSDSHVTRGWPEELRWLEYGQRLHHLQRNVAAAPGREPSTAARLFEAALHAGARASAASSAGASAAAQPLAGLQVGARADLLVLPEDDAATAALPPDHTLDGLVFGGATRPFERVLVAGRWARPSTAPTPCFSRVMRELWAG